MDDWCTDVTVPPFALLTLLDGAGESECLTWESGNVTRRKSHSTQAFQSGVEYSRSQLPSNSHHPSNAKPLWNYDQSNPMRENKDWWRGAVIYLAYLAMGLTTDLDVSMK